MQEAPVWRFTGVPWPQVEALARACGIPAAAAAVLYQRGYTTPEAVRAFLDPAAYPHPDPFVLRGMDDAVARLVQAVRRGERIVVYGDYDVDGQAGTALLVAALSELGAQVDYYIPSRLVEGYGLSERSVRLLAARADLIVTVDCGVTAVHEVDVARRLGIDVVVTDHHEPGLELPAAVAVVDPKRADCLYPDKGLCGCAVAYKLVRALLAALGRDPAAADAWLDLVALATIADVVPLVGENRALAAKGLAHFDRRPGLRALCRVAGVDATALKAGHVAFSVAPRLNAAGRLADASLGVRLLLTRDEGEAAALADELDRHNAARQRIEQGILDEARARIEAGADPAARGLVVVGEGWHRGVIGIVAARLVEAYRRPAIVISVEGSEAVGSGRSIPAFNLHRALSDLRHHLTRFGGHWMAAGLTMPAEGVEAFRNEFVALAGERLAPADLAPLVAVEAVLPPAALTLELAAALERLAPFGLGNPEPVVAVCEGHVAESRRLGKDETHWRVCVGADGGQVECIGFGMAPAFASRVRLGDAVDVAGTLSVNRWNGTERVQLQLRDARFSVAPAVRLAERAALTAEAAAARDAGGAVAAPEVHVVRCGAREVRAVLHDLRRAAGDVRAGALEAALAAADHVLLVAGFGGLPRLVSRVRREAARGEVFVCTGGVPVTAEPRGRTALVLWGVPEEIGQLAAAVRAAASWAAEDLEVYVTFSAPVRAEVEAQVAADWPDIGALRSVYRALRARAVGGRWLVDTEQLAALVTSGGTPLSPAGVTFALDVFAEAGLIVQEGDEATGRRVRLLDMQGRKVDLTATVRYNEGAKRRDRLCHVIRQCGAGRLAELFALSKDASADDRGADGPRR